MMEPGFSYGARYQEMRITRAQEVPHDHQEALLLRAGGRARTQVA